MNSYKTPTSIFIYFLFILSIQTAKAQIFSHEFGKYSLEEFQLKSYDKDPTAEAVVIYDIGESYFIEDEGNFRIVFKRNLKFKIFNKTGLRWAQFEIPYYFGDNNYEDIYDLQGNTYNFENGKVRTSQLDKRNVYEEKKDEHWFLKKFAMPDVKEGSVVEITYKISTPYKFNFRGWEFQQDIPVMYSEYKTKMIPFYSYNYILQGASKFDSFKSYEDPGFEKEIRGVKYREMVYEFVMRDIPAFKNEGFITSANDYLIRLEFQLSEFRNLYGSVTKIITTWPKAIEEYLDHEDFGKYLKSSIKSAKNIVDTMKGTSETTLQRVKILDRYVKSNFNWNGRTSELASKSVKEFIKTRSGNSADINLYLAGLLKAAGVEAYPVIISTRDHGKINVTYPYLHYFNYVVVVASVEGKLLIMDATEPLCNLNEIPIRSMNDIGLIINKDKSEWLSFYSTSPSVIRDSIDLTFNKSIDSLTATFNITTTSYDALKLRKYWTGNNKDKIKDELFLENCSFDDSIEINNLTQIENPFELRFRAKQNTEILSNKILISPFAGAVISENPFKQLIRSYPVDMIYKKEREYTSVLHIPDGYKLIKKPENVDINNILLNIQYKIEQVDTKTLKIKASYGFRKEVYESSDYTYLKAMYNKIVNMLNDKIILAKE